MLSSFHLLTHGNLDIENAIELKNKEDSGHDDAIISFTSAQEKRDWTSELRNLIKDHQRQFVKKKIFEEGDSITRSTSGGKVTVSKTPSPTMMSNLFLMLY